MFFLLHLAGVRKYKPPNPHQHPASLYNPNMPFEFTSLLEALPMGKHPR